jgi:uroporphyrinogen decarboxylase
MEKFKERCPATPLVYYSKGTGPDHWKSLIGMPISCLGIDWRQDLKQVLESWTDHWSIQGNIDPSWLFLDSIELESRLRKIFQGVKDLPQTHRRGWVCGLGHGVLPKTPESNVRLFLKLQKEYFSE